VCGVALCMKLDSFEHRLDKMALALMSGVEAKNDSVKEFGIGEDLPISIFCWKNNKLRLMLQLRADIQKATQQERFQAITSAACVTRRGWGVDEFSLVSEAYLSHDPVLTKDIELKNAFVDPRYNVQECLTVMHVDSDRVSFVVKTYKYNVPRLVVWGDEEYRPGSTMVRSQDGMYPNMFSRVIKTIDKELEPFDVREFYNTLAHGLLESGFYIQQFE